MAQGLKKGEPSGRDVYADIIDHPHWEPKEHIRMSLYDRTPQFASYKALSGYEDMVAEETRLTDTELTLEEHALNLLNQKIALISDAIEAGYPPLLSFTVFVPDQTKSGGAYVDVTDTVKRLDMTMRKFILASTRASGLNETIDFDKIVAINGDLVDCLDD